MEKINVSNELFEKISKIKKEKGLNGFSAALDVLITDLENELKSKNSETERFQKEIDEKNNELESLRKQLKDLSENGLQGSEEQSKKIQELEDVVAHQNEELKKLRENVSTDNSEVIAELEAKNEELIQELKEANQRANDNAQKLTAFQLASEQPKKGVYMVELPPMADELIQVTVNRLREKLNVPDLTPAALLRDLFVKYTAKRPSDFAYPFVISKDEFKVILSRYQ